MHLFQFLAIEMNISVLVVVRFCVFLSIWFLHLQTSSDFCVSPDTYVVKVANQYGVIKQGTAQMHQQPV